MSTFVIKRDVEIEKFPVGCRVITPSKNIGTVIAHIGLSEKAIARALVRFGPGFHNHFRKNDEALILPKWLTLFDYSEHVSGREK